MLFLITTPKPAQPAPHAAPCAPPRYAPLHRPARLSPVSGSRVRAQRTAARRSRGAHAVGIEMMRHMASSHANTAHASREGGRAGAFQCTRRAQHWRAGLSHLVSSHRRTRAVGPARPHAATRGRHREGSREEREGSRGGSQGAERRGARCRCRRPTRERPSRPPPFFGPVLRRRHTREERNVALLSTSLYFLELLALATEYIMVAPIATAAPMPLCKSMLSPRKATVARRITTRLTVLATACAVADTSPSTR